MKPGRNPCPRCGSRDNLFIYPDGHGHCFSVSCGYHIFGKEIDLNQEYTYEYLPWRGPSEATMRKFKVKTRINAEGKPVAVVYPYGAKASLVRWLDRPKDDAFRWEGEASEASLFGADIFSAGEAQAVTITEGAQDALSAFEMLGSKYPVLSVRSASSARKDCAARFDYINSFQKIYLALDNDEPGQKAAKEIAGLFDFNKIYHVQLTKKDANDYHMAREGDKFAKIWWNAKRYLPQGIFSSFAEFDKIIDEKEMKHGAPYPFKTLNDMTYGIRPGEFVLLTGLEGIGKTEILRTAEYHYLKNTKEKVGIIHCEEDEDRILRGIAGLELGVPCHLPDSPVSKQEIKDAYRRVAGDDERIHLYSPFEIDDPDAVLDNMRFLATVCGCKLIAFDNITKTVSGLDIANVTQKLDYLSTKIAAMAKERDVAVVVISHVNDEGLTRGSRNISKVCNIWIHVDRNVKAGTLEERNTSYLTINKNRYSGRTGPAGRLWFDPGTFALTEIIPIEQVEAPVN